MSSFHFDLIRKNAKENPHKKLNELIQKAKHAFYKSSLIESAMRDVEQQALTMQDDPYAWIKLDSLRKDYQVAKEIQKLKSSLYTHEDPDQLIIPGLEPQDL